ncbi:MAG TPA: Uma2 family endonuclease [Candidatus Competibacteraceae bacterium]|nr:Uma2 family endonuclease [Candidatus Competibacteraceae bacterium]HRZ04980.1 Uma2 family endonuclease [Candidatus Competibacteraceae bacterium]HSA45261.1 Uma2 family endonuclease [Candidatus Competibacteraceae bacterium]
MSAVLLPRPSLPNPPEPYDGMAVSEADYWEFYYLGHDVTYEWNDGVLEEKGVSDYLTFRVYDWFIQLLTEFLHTYPMADRVGLEMGFRLALPNKVVIRRPDYGVVRHDNPAPLTGLAQSYRGIFDLCIEGVSTSSKAMQERDTVVKKVEYAAGGVREYYLLHRSPRLRQFYQLSARGVYEPMPVAPGGIIQSTVLPGFQWRLDDLDRQPALDTLIDDPVYQQYVLLNLQQAQQRVEQAEQCIQQERQRAERLAAQLRALGIDPDAE